MKKVIFVSSTGGHLTELLQLKTLFDETLATVVTEKTKSNQNLKNTLKNRLKQNPVAFFTPIIKRLS